MKKSKFIHKLYLLFLLAVIAYYVFINVFGLIQGRNALAFLPLTIQPVLIILILLHHRWLGYTVKAFSLLCIIPSLLRLFGQLMFVLAGGTSKIDYDLIIKCLLTVLVGAILLILCDKSIRLVEK